jgi:hypothetical protein
LRERQRDLQALTGSARAVELAETLAQAAGLADGEQLTFEVVLVARPHRTDSRANQSGSYLVVEVLEESPASRQVPALFHELAHLAVRHAPFRPALEQALVGHGASGLVAANLWEESFATAFGNGMAARALDPTFTPDRSLYLDDAIDALGRALYLRWAAGSRVTVDAALADSLLGLVDSAWPRQRWRMADLFGRMLLASEDREAASLLQASIRARSVYRWAPLPEDLTSPNELASLPRIVMATLPTLQTRSDVLRLFALEVGDVQLRLSRHGSGVYSTESDAGVQLLVTAQSRDGLIEAARAFAALQRPPAPGWTNLEP